MLFSGELWHCEFVCMPKDFQGGRDIISYLYIGVNMGSNLGQNGVSWGQNGVNMGSKMGDIISYSYVFRIFNLIAFFRSFWYVLTHHYMCLYTCPIHFLYLCLDFSYIVIPLFDASPILFRMFHLFSYMLMQLPNMLLYAFVRSLTCSCMLTFPAFRPYTFLHVLTTSCDFLHASYIPFHMFST